MAKASAKELFDKGMEALVHNKTLAALAFFEKGLQLEDNPSIYPPLAFCIAKERGQTRKAIELCEEAIQKDPSNALHYLYLGKIYLHIHNRDYAIMAFRAGLKYETNSRIIDELNKLATRKPPVISFLKRSNPVNKYLGIVLAKLGLR
ncbi:MAG TPA: tetratricopeptide repeat protein [Dissulfurispiraceae bacterium]